MRPAAPRQARGRHGCLRVVRRRAVWLCFPAWGWVGEGIETTEGCPAQSVCGTLHTHRRPHRSWRPPQAVRPGRQRAGEWAAPAGAQRAAEVGGRVQPHPGFSCTAESPRRAGLALRCSASGRWARKLPDGPRGGAAAVRSPAGAWVTSSPCVFWALLTVSQVAQLRFIPQRRRYSSAGYARFRARERAFA